MAEHFDCIVLGTGCGGAAAAALAAHSGKRTLVLEKGKLIGGRCATHEIRGFKMDHGHLISRCAKGPHGEVMRRVDSPDLMPPYVQGSRLPQKIRILDKDIYLKEKKGNITLDSLGDLALFKAFGFSLAEWVQAARLFLAVAFMSEESTKKLDNVTPAEWVSRYTDNKYIHSIFGAMSCVSFGALPHEASTGALIRSWRISIKENSMGYPINGEGASAIPKGFLRAAERFGAEVRVNTGAEKIIVDNGRVKGVMVNGELISADMVISNAGIRETVLYLVGEKHYEAPYVERIKGLKYSYGGISLKYALDKPIIDWHHGGKVPVNFVKNMTDAFEGRVPEETAMMLVATSNIDPSLAPPGKQTLLVISPGPVAEPGATKWKPWVKSLKRQVEEWVPGIEKHTLFCVASTPDVIARQNSRTFGDAVGVAQTSDQVGENAPSAVSPIPGLFHVGADIGSEGVATEMATQSALDLFDYLEKNRIT